MIYEQNPKNPKLLKKVFKIYIWQSTGYIQMTTKYFFLFYFFKSCCLSSVQITVQFTRELNNILQQYRALSWNS